MRLDDSKRGDPLNSPRVESWTRLRPRQPTCNDKNFIAAMFLMAKNHSPCGLAASRPGDLFCLRSPASGSPQVNRLMSSILGFPQDVGQLADGPAEIANREFCAIFAFSRGRWHSPGPGPPLNCAPHADFIASLKCRETCQTVWRSKGDSNLRCREQTFRRKTGASVGDISRRNRPAPCRE